ncbi:transposase family protein [Streptomyces sp. GTA36]
MRTRGMQERQWITTRRCELDALADDRGRLLWISAARPGRTTVITACRHDQLTQKLREVGLGAIADLGFVGFDDSGPDAGPAVITGYKAARNRPLTRGQKLSNTALTAVRAPVEDGFAHLKNWRVLGKVRTDPAWATALVRALLVLTTAKSPDDRRSSPKPPASDQRPASRCPRTPAP